MSISTLVSGQETKPDHLPGFKTVHLINIGSIENEPQLLGIADEFNKLITELGYDNVHYYTWKQIDGRDGKFEYIFGSTWPDKETYFEVTKLERFKEVWKACYAIWQEIVIEDVYNRYDRLK